MLRVYRTAILAGAIIGPIIAMWAIDSRSYGQFDFAPLIFVLTQITLCVTTTGAACKICDPDGDFPHSSRPLARAVVLFTAPGTLIFGTVLCFAAALRLGADVPLEYPPIPEDGHMAELLVWRLAGSQKTDSRHLQVSRLDRNGETEKAGLKIGDIVVAIDNLPYDSGRVATYALKQGECDEQHVLQITRITTDDADPENLYIVVPINCHLEYDGRVNTYVHNDMGVGMSMNGHVSVDPFKSLMLGGILALDHLSTTLSNIGATVTSHWQEAKTSAPSSTMLMVQWSPLGQELIKFGMMATALGLMAMIPASLLALPWFIRDPKYPTKGVEWDVTYVPIPIDPMLKWYIHQALQDMKSAAHLQRYMKGGNLHVPENSWIDSKVLNKEDKKRQDGETDEWYEWFLKSVFHATYHRIHKGLLHSYRQHVWPMRILLLLFWLVAMVDLVVLAVANTLLTGL